MRGEVLHYDDEQGFGFINGADGKRYAFERGDLRRLVPVGKGTVVEFQIDGATAREIFVIRSDMRASAPAQLRPRRGRRRAREHRAVELFRAHADIQLRQFPRTGAAQGILGLRAVLDDPVDDRHAASASPSTAARAIWSARRSPTATVVAVGLFLLATFIPGIALTVRRQHDIGLSGWFYLLVLVPYVGGLIVFVFTLIPSQKHDNKWGPVPYGVRV